MALLANKTEGVMSTGRVECHLEPEVCTLLHIHDFPTRYYFTGSNVYQYEADEFKADQVIENFLNDNKYLTFPQPEDSIASLITKGKNAHQARKADKVSQAEDKSDFDLIADVFNQMFAKKIVSMFGTLGKDFYKTETKASIYIILILIPLCYLVTKISF